MTLGGVFWTMTKNAAGDGCTGVFARVCGAFLGEKDKNPFSASGTICRSSFPDRPLFGEESIVRRGSKSPWRRSAAKCHEAVNFFGIAKAAHRSW